MDAQIPFLEHVAYNLREASLKMTSAAGSGHPTSCLSAADIMAALFFHAMRYDLHNPENPDNDRFILSKGHAAPLLYAVYKELAILSEHDLMTYRSIGSNLEGHPTRRFVYSESATGSLGIGLSIGNGIALNAKLEHRNYRTYVLLGDSEIAEGSVWEAAEIAAYYKLNNLIAILDCNRLGQSTPTMHEHHMHRYEEKFKAFGWQVILCDGHDIQRLIEALDKAKKASDKPVIIIAKTIKGYGVEQVEDKEGFHGKVFGKEELDGILQQFAVRFRQSASFKETNSWHPTLSAPTEITKKESSTYEIPNAHYKKGDSIATREAYGRALAALGRTWPEMIALDAEVKNSTYAYLFEEKFPQRFFQCFIAEQNMVGMAVGFESRGKIPFVSTFGAFMSRAHDQIRMAAIAQSAVRLVGSHAGVSIGADGPSQMALEDIALMRCLPESIVLYPCDAVSTHNLVALMAEYRQGISYLRTTRSATPVLYNVNEEFPLGGCKILKQSSNDVACIVAAGITVFEALAAYDLLQQEGIFVAIIDLYCVKPLDTTTLVRLGKACGNSIITVEDHYLQGGIGEAVATAICNEGIHVYPLAVTTLPRSGKPNELMALMGIDATSIVQTVMKLCKKL